MSQPSNGRSFIDTQYQFANAIRDPLNSEIPDNIEQRRMAIYQELFYNNIHSFITNGFPVLKGIFNDSDWDAMIRDFMVKHHCKTPLFHEISREFLNYLDNERDLSNDPVFIKELAHYEWVELALTILDAECEPVMMNQQQDCLELKLQLSPLAYSLTYHYPVHLISPDFLPENQNNSPVYLLVYRDQNDHITFLELNSVSARLIELLNQNLTGSAAAQKIANELQHPNTDIVMNGARELISDWLERKVLSSNLG